MCYNQRVSYWTGITNKNKGVRRMKKFLAMLGLLMVFSQPVFAQCCPTACNQCNPCLTGAACPVTTCNPCNPCVPTSCIKIVPIAKTCVRTCVPVCDPCNPCATGAAAPVTVSAFAVDPEYEYYCCPKRGFWRNFFSF